MSEKRNIHAQVPPGATWHSPATVRYCVISLFPFDRGLCFQKHNVLFISCALKPLYVLYKMSITFSPSHFAFST
jgi:hypothetical protein